MSALVETNSISKPVSTRAGGEFAIVPAGIPTSDGHDFYALLAKEALTEQGMLSNTVPLQPAILEESPWLSRNFWESINRGKEGLAISNGRHSLLEPLINLFADSIRSNHLINSLLAGELEQRLEGQDRISSHYMAFTRSTSSGRNILLGPDWFSQAPVAPALNQGRINKVLSPNPSFTADLFRRGADPEKIIPHGIVVPEKLVAASIKRLNTLPTRSIGMASVGGTAAEAPQLANTIMHLTERGHELHVVYPLNHERKLWLNNTLNDFRRGLDNYHANLLHLHPCASKEEALGIRMELMANPDISFSINRPNEMSVLLAYLMRGQILLNAVGSHEQKAERLLHNKPGFVKAAPTGTLSAPIEAVLCPILLPSENRTLTYPLQAAASFSAIVQGL